MDDKKHWDTVFATKAENEVSWYQKVPQTSLTLIDQFNLSKEAKIIDVGGGDSYLIDSLVAKGYTNLYLLDISEQAIDKVKKRLGNYAASVTFIVSKNIDLVTNEKFDVWHDRASFHFLTETNDVNSYVNLTRKYIADGGVLILGAFSESGPKKCSGLEVTQYSTKKMGQVFNADFNLVNSFTEDHQTPFNTVQNFIFCTFNKK